MSPALVQKTKEKDEKKRSQQTQRAEPEPDVTVHDDVNQSVFARPSYDDIAVIAYSYWLERGQPDGSPEEDWLRAERELTGQRRSGQ